MVMIPTWTRTIGHLMANDAEVVAHCSACGGSWDADLERIAKAKGVNYTLWNRTTRCRTVGCKGKVWFKASIRGGGVWPTQMRNARMCDLVAAGLR